MNSEDRRELDRQYHRLMDRLAAPARSRSPIDARSIAELQAFMDRVREEESDTRDTDPMPADD
jgi:hypothetical protein